MFRAAPHRISAVKTISAAARRRQSAEFAAFVRLRGSCRARRIVQFKGNGISECGNRFIFQNTSANSTFSVLCAVRCSRGRRVNNPIVCRVCRTLRKGKTIMNFKTVLFLHCRQGCLFFERAVAQPISGMKKDRYFYLPSFLYSVCILIIQKAVLSNQYFCP